VSNQADARTHGPAALDLLRPGADESLALSPPPAATI